ERRAIKRMRDDPSRLTGNEQLSAGLADDDRPAGLDRTAVLLPAPEQSRPLKRRHLEEALDRLRTAQLLPGLAQIPRRQRGEAAGDRLDLLLEVAQFVGGVGEQRLIVGAERFVEFETDLAERGQKLAEF